MCTAPSNAIIWTDRIKGLFRGTEHSSDYFTALIWSPSRQELWLDHAQSHTDPMDLPLSELDNVVTNSVGSLGKNHGTDSEKSQSKKNIF